MVGVNPLTEKLRSYVEEIKFEAKLGNIKAQQIIKLYRMHCDCPNDQGAFALCEATFDDWIKNR